MLEVITWNVGFSLKKDPRGHLESNTWPSDHLMTMMPT